MVKAHSPEGIQTHPLDPLVDPAVPCEVPTWQIDGPQALTWQNDAACPQAPTWHNIAGKVISNIFKQYKLNVPISLLEPNVDSFLGHPKVQSNFFKFLSAVSSRKLAAVLWSSHKAGPGVPCLQGPRQLVPEREWRCDSTGFTSGLVTGWCVLLAFGSLTCLSSKCHQAMAFLWLGNQALFFFHQNSLAANWKN